MGVLLKNIADMRERGELCDVVVTVEKQQFQLHRLVLAASSDFFHAMFTSGFQEKDKNEIQLIGQTAANFKSFLCYVYSGCIQLTDENIEDVYGIATYLQAGELIEHCKEYMSSNITVENCVRYLGLAEEFNNTQIFDKAVKVVAENFFSFEDEELLFKLKPAIFKAVLQHEKLSETDEDRILYSVRQWLTTNNADEATTREIVEEIRWGLLDVHVLESYLEDDENDPVLGSEVCREMIQKAINYLGDERMQPILGGRFSTPRGLPVLAAFGGDTGEFIHESVALGDDDIGNPRFWFGPNTIESLPMPLHYRECNASVVINNVLFLIGGYQYGYDEDDGSDTLSSPHVLKYNPIVNRWRMMATLSTGRLGHSAVAVEYSDGTTGIMVIGGCCKYVGDIPSTATYDIVNDTWLEEDNFPHRLMAPGACVYNGYVYVSGGRTETHCTNYMYRYHPDTREWERLSDMLNRRSSHSMCIVDNHFYIIGRQMYVENHDDYAEMYDPLTDQYSRIDWIWPFFAEGNCVVYKERIYRVRGECSALTFDTVREEVIKNTFFTYSHFGEEESLVDYSTMNSSLAIFHIRNQVEQDDEYESDQNRESDGLEDVDFDSFDHFLF